MEELASGKELKGIVLATALASFSPDEFAAMVHWLDESRIAILQQKLTDILNQLTDEQKGSAAGNALIRLSRALQLGLQEQTFCVTKGSSRN